MMRWSNNCTILFLGWWMEVMIVLPSWASFFKVRQTESAWNESRPLVGSSRNKMLGSEINSTPTLTLFFSPPETPLWRSFPMITSWALANPKQSSSYLECWWCSWHELLFVWELTFWKGRSFRRTSKSLWLLEKRKEYHLASRRLCV